VTVLPKQPCQTN